MEFHLEIAEANEEGDSQDFLIQHSLRAGRSQAYRLRVRYHKAGRPQASGLVAFRHYAVLIPRPPQAATPFIAAITHAFTWATKWDGGFSPPW
jgi:hypothetical protein